MYERITCEIDEMLLDINQTIYYQFGCDYPFFDRDGLTLIIRTSKSCTDKEEFSDYYSMSFAVFRTIKTISYFY